jgi:hypothetical protein
MAMKPANLFHLSNFPPRLRIFHFHSQQLMILACLRADNVARRSYSRLSRNISQTSPTFGLQVLDCVMKRFDENQRDQTLVDIGRANVVIKKKYWTTSPEQNTELS